MPNHNARDIIEIGCIRQQQTEEMNIPVRAQMRTKRVETEARRQRIRQRDCQT